eukprot:s980_g15.t1
MKESTEREKTRDAALVALSREFVCFMAKRKGKADSNEINYGRASEEMRQKLNESRVKEWANGMKYKAVRFPTEEELTVLRERRGDEIPRWVNIDKNEKLRAPGGEEVPETLKSRLVIRGDLEQQQFRTDCFWLELRASILANKLLEVDPPFYVLQRHGEMLGMLCSHVDDQLWRGSEEMDAVMERIQERFTFGSTEHGSFRFCGRKITTEEDYIHVQAPESLSKVKPIHIEGGRQAIESKCGGFQEHQQVAVFCSEDQGQRDKIYERKALFRNFHFLPITDVSHGVEVEINAEGNKQGHRSQGGRILLLADRVPDDSGETNIHILEWHSQTLKRVCCPTLQAEVLLSMLGSEAAQQVPALLHSLHCPRIPGDHGKEWKIQAADSKLIVWMSNCKSFIDHMSATTPGSVSDKRVAIDMSPLRQELWRDHREEVGDPSGSAAMPVDATDQLFWICTGDMIVDQLTKRMRWDASRTLCDCGVLRFTVKPI